MLLMYGYHALKSDLISYYKSVTNNTIKDSQYSILVFNLDLTGKLGE